MLEISNSDRLQQCSLNGRCAAEQEFNWKHDRGRLIKMYEELLNQESRLPS